MDLIFMEYDIIKHIERNNSELYIKIKELYNICRDLLSEIPKFFSNYTLHDIGHSIRVIGYMNELVKNRLNEFSDLHLALIVYVGLLHDTGMVITDDEKKELYTIFEKRDFEFKNYSEEDKILYLQDYIRKNHGERVSNILNQKINCDTKIKSLLYEGETKSYDLSKIIADICWSHTEDCNWIINNLDSTRYYGDYEINPQHIALLLRIGDALDIDDRRAPYMLYRILNIKGDSNNEWRKHIPITNYKKICEEHQKYEIVFSGECSEPIIYRKIMEYIEDVNDDIKKVLSICEYFDELYKLNITVPLTNNIKTIGFIETPLRFNLQYKQISKLLMGEKIYGTKKDGLRELLQNGIDTVLLMKSLNEDNLYVPKIGIEINKENNKFIVFDNGTGMSDDILEKYFFNIGNSYYVSDEFCNEKHAYEPIGHFGIGFLACFMLASKIDIVTKHYHSAQIIRMSFDKESPYVTKLDCGQENFLLAHGTRIIMDYDAVIPKIFSCKEEILNYIREILLIDEYEFWVIDGDKERLYVDIPGKKYLTQNNNFEFDYDLKTYINVRFNILDFFENNEKVYIADEISDFNESNYISLGFFKEIIEGLEANLQTSGEEINYVNDMAKMAGVPDFVYELINQNMIDLRNYYNKNGNIIGFFNNYLYKFINENLLTWYDIPIILHKNTFNSFLDTIEEEGLERALNKYKSDIQYVSIICKNNILTSDLVLEIVGHFIDVFENGDDTTDVSYYSSYPVLPIKKNIELLGFPESNSYIRIVHNYQEFVSKLYLRGIRVRDEDLIISHSIAGIELDNVFVNIKSGNYGTDV